MLVPDVDAAGEAKVEAAGAFKWGEAAIAAMSTMFGLTSAPFDEMSVLLYYYCRLSFMYVSYCIGWLARDQS
jgi:hypothetical protein